MKVRAYPPAGQTWKYGTAKVGAKGVDVPEGEADALKLLGWTVSDKKTRKRQKSAEVKSNG